MSGTRKRKSSSDHEGNPKKKQKTTSTQNQRAFCNYPLLEETTGDYAGHSYYEKVNKQNCVRKALRFAMHEVVDFKTVGNKTYLLKKSNLQESKETVLSYEQMIQQWKDLCAQDEAKLSEPRTRKLFSQEPVFYDATRKLFFYKGSYELKTSLDTRAKRIGLTIHFSNIKERIGIYAKYGLPANESLIKTWRAKLLEYDKKNNTKTLDAFLADKDEEMPPMPDVSGSSSAAARKQNSEEPVPFAAVAYGAGAGSGSGSGSEDPVPFASIAQGAGAGSGSGSGASSAARISPTFFNREMARIQNQMTEMKRQSDLRDAETQRQIDELKQQVVQQESQQHFSSTAMSLFELGISTEAVSMSLTAADHASDLDLQLTADQEIQDVAGAGLGVLSSIDSEEDFYARLFRDDSQVRADDIDEITKENESLAKRAGCDSMVKL